MDGFTSVIATCFGFTAVAGAVMSIMQTRLSKARIPLTLTMISVGIIVMVGFKAWLIGVLHLMVLTPVVYFAIGRMSKAGKDGKDTPNQLKFTEKIGWAALLLGLVVLFSFAGSLKQAGVFVLRVAQAENPDNAALLNGFPGMWIDILIMLIPLVLIMWLSRGKKPSRTMHGNQVSEHPGMSGGES